MNKVQKIREEVRKIARSINPYIPDDEGKNSEYEAGRFAMVTQIMQIIDSMQEEPVSEDLEEACEQLTENARKHKAETSSPFFSQTDYRQGVMAGAKWQKQQIKKSMDLGEPPYLISVEQAYYRTVKLLED